MARLIAPDENIARIRYHQNTFTSVLMTLFLMIFHASGHRLVHQRMALWPSVYANKHVKEPLLLYRKQLEWPLAAYHLLQLINDTLTWP